MKDIGHSQRLVRQWLIGLLGSWSCVWFAGPWIVNSILVRVNDAELAAITLREGDVIRWRSEGWASTLVGPHGRPGWKPNQASKRIVIWGDSQVEGFCVNDSEKISNQVIRIAQEQYGQSLDCVPMGRSGADASDWNRMLSAADELWQPIAHVWIITELADLTALSNDAVLDNGSWQAESPTAVVLAKKLHAEAAFQTVRNVMLEPTSGARRSLRWSVGPVRDASDAALTVTMSQDTANIFTNVLKRLKLVSEQVDQRLLIVYAPSVPRILDRVVTTHPDDASWDAFATLLAESNIDAIDMRGAFIDGYRVDGRMPRGFHNGTPSFGHLNAFGNRLVAAAIAERLAKHRAVSSRRLSLRETAEKRYFRQAKGDQP